MSNLSDLLPAGAGAKVITATASGNLATGETVALKSDGTVEVIAATSASTGSVTNFDSGSSMSYGTQSVVYDVSQSKILITYADQGNSSYITGVVGTVSGTSISFGTPTVIDSSGVSAAASVYCPDISKTCCFFKKSSNNYTEAKVITISGTSISFSGASGLSTPNREAMSPVFDPDNNKVIFNYRDESNSRYGTTQVCTVTSTTVTAATAVVWASVYAGGSRLGAVYDTLNDKVVISYFQDTATPRGKSVVGTVSGTTTSWGTPVEFNAAEVGNVDAAFDSNANKVVVVYRDAGSTSDGTVIVGTVSGTSISFGSETVYATGQANLQKIVYDTGAKKSVLIYTDSDGGTGGGGDGRIVEITVSGTTATVANDARIIDDARYGDPAGAYDSSVGRAVFAFRDSVDNDNDAIVHQTSSTNSGDFVGITDEAIANTATGSVVVEGGQITNSALIAAYLSAGSSATFESATNQSLNSVYDPDSQKVIFAYADKGNSERGTAVVGTVSGTSISFGTPVVFTTPVSGGPLETTLAYDTVNDKVVISYRNQGNSNYPESVVGTVSGTSISFGTPVVINSTASSGTASAFDTASGKVVVATSDSSSTGAAIVGTVSGTSISFGSFTNFDSPATAVSDIGATYDSTNGKVVIAYRDQGNSNYGTAVVGTVSGTSISFGTPVVFNAGDSEKMDQAVVYDSTNQKVVIGYKDVGNSNYGTAIVGTVSGTSISFGTEVVFDASTLGSIELSGAFNSSRGEVGFVFGSSNTSFYPAIIAGTVSGTSISFGSSLTLNTVNGNYYSLTYDVNADKFVAPYNNTSTSDAKVVSSSTDLTVGSTYYVQDDGSVSTTSSSVTAGKAIATNKLLLKG